MNTVNKSVDNNLKDCSMVSLRFASWCLFRCISFSCELNSNYCSSSLLKPKNGVLCMDIIKRCRNHVYTYPPVPLFYIDLEVAHCFCCDSRAFLLCISYTLYVSVHSIYWEKSISNNKVTVSMCIAHNSYSSEEAQQ